MLVKYLDFPLDKGVGIWVAVDAEEEEPLALLVVAVVGVKNLYMFLKTRRQHGRRKIATRKNKTRLLTSFTDLNNKLH